MTELLHSIENMPLAGLVPAFMLMIAGFVLWIAGRQILRGAFVAMGLMLGALAGVLIDDAMMTGMPAWVLPTLCAVGLAVFAAVMYRLGAAVLLSITLAIASPMMVIAVNQWQVERGRGISADGDEQIEVSSSIDQTLAQHQQQLDDAASTMQDVASQAQARLQESAAKRGLDDELALGMDKAKAVSRAVADAIIAHWHSAPKRLRPIVSLSAIIGALSGLIIGLIARRFGDCAVTALTGAAIWLGCAHLIAVRAGGAYVSEGPWLPRSMIAWLGVWLIVSIIGLCVQWARKQAPADKPR